MSASVKVLGSIANPAGFSGNVVSEDANGDLFVVNATTGDDPALVYEIANTATGYAATPTLVATLSTTDELLPYGALLVDANGDLFGAAELGGDHGTLFEIANTATGYTNTATVLAAFNGIDGASPIGLLIEDANGDLFGVTAPKLDVVGVGPGIVFEIENTVIGLADTPPILQPMGAAWDRCRKVPCS
jgi:hypothetical protein